MASGCLGQIASHLVSLCFLICVMGVGTDPQCSFSLIVYDSRPERRPWDFFNWGQGWVWGPLWAFTSGHSSFPSPLSPQSQETGTTTASEKMSPGRRQLARGKQSHGARPDGSAFHRTRLILISV